ncbi:aminotransferase class I/II-fold pyridoxal phosphate-dependent enzyme [uncultured Thiothrix sp.]|uniref:DegT/DnrJ/EryC1/StrS family aminotransferase n=1 Tax=uncultured Thiothrix sp. TaxID=223185 RepID=UPI0026340EFF|nr:aminotransferase class I/II-fold pyridoxal phosphate-dependent enzyme [uncultured Thiothrix sp.]
MIPVYKPFLNGNEKKYVTECLDSSWISSKGAFIDQFERKFSSYIGSPYATSVSNGTVALHLALKTLGIGSGDEVIVPSLTYIASVNTIIETGAKPVYVDSLLSTWQLDPDDIEKKITKKTKAILAVHLYGLPCDMDSLVTICKQYRILLIEDCAEAFGSYYKNKHVGTFGDISTFSFFGNKTITTGEGGMVVSNQKDLIDTAYHLKNQGVSKKIEYWHDSVAYNYRMTNICAAIGLAQLEQADTILARKQAIANNYLQSLAQLPLKVQFSPSFLKNSYWMFSILVSDLETRNNLRKFLADFQIETRPVFYPSHHLPHCKTDDYLPNADYISQRGINLPSFPDLLEDEIKFICLKISDFYKN